MSARRGFAALGLLAAAALAPQPALAERVVLSLSTNRVSIDSNYTGGRIVVFGVIERDGQSVGRPGDFDVVVTVSGPREALTVRRKERLGPVWLNRDQQKFVAVPAVLGVYANRPLPEIAALPLRTRLRLGTDALVGAPEFALDRGGTDDPFRSALIRLKSRDGLWQEDGRGVTFVTPDFFRSAMSLPATAPTGDYDVEAVVLSNGVPVARQSASFEVVKAGFEDQVTMTAREHALPYGLSIAAMSLLFGWLASVIFRRD